MVLYELLDYLRNSSNLKMDYEPLEEVVEPADISPLHKNYRIIKFLINSQIMKLDEENRFNPTSDISPAKILISLRKILGGLTE